MMIIQELRLTSKVYPNTGNCDFCHTEKEDKTSQFYFVPTKMVVVRVADGLAVSRIWSSMVV